MNTILNQKGATESSGAKSGGVFGVIASTLQDSGRRLGCWDDRRYPDERFHGLTPAPTVNGDNLVAALAMS